MQAFPEPVDNCMAVGKFVNECISETTRSVAYFGLYALRTARDLRKSFRVTLTMGN